MPPKCIAHVNPFATQATIKSMQPPLPSLHSQPTDSYPTQPISDATARLLAEAWRPHGGGPPPPALPRSQDAPPSSTTNSPDCDRLHAIYGPSVSSMPGLRHEPQGHASLTTWARRQGLERPARGCSPCRGPHHRRRQKAAVRSCFAHRGGGGWRWRRAAAAGRSGRCWGSA